MIFESNALGRALHGFVMHRFKRLIYQHTFRTPYYFLRNA